MKTHSGIIFKVIFILMIGFWGCHIKANEIENFSQKYKIPLDYSNVTEQMDQYVTESISTFNGTLSLTVECISLPGRKGQTLSLNPVYTSKIWGDYWTPDYTDSDNYSKTSGFLGVGWQLHLGRINLDKGYVEWGDGTREQITQGDNLNSGVTTQFKKYYDVVSYDPEYERETYVQYKNGTKVYFNHDVSFKETDNSSELTFWRYATRIEDVDGNVVTIHYYGNTDRLRYIEDTKGQLIMFYLTGNTVSNIDRTISEDERLHHIKFPGRLLNNSNNIYFQFNPKNNLESIQYMNDDIVSFQYRNSQNLYFEGELNKVTLPNGGEYTYQYDDIELPYEDAIEMGETEYAKYRGIHTKQVNDQNGNNVTTTYEFYPPQEFENSGRNLVKTSVTEPNGIRTDYFHEPLNKRAPGKEGRHRLVIKRDTGVELRKEFFYWSCKKVGMFDTQVVETAVLGGRGVWKKGVDGSDSFEKFVNYRQNLSNNYDMESDGYNSTDDYDVWGNPPYKQEFGEVTDLSLAFGDLSNFEDDAIGFTDVGDDYRKTVYTYTHENNQNNYSFYRENYLVSLKNKIVTRDDNQNKIRETLQLFDGENLNESSEAKGHLKERKKWIENDKYTTKEISYDSYGQPETIQIKQADNKWFRAKLIYDPQFTTFVEQVLIHDGTDYNEQYLTRDHFYNGLLKEHQDQNGNEYYFKYDNMNRLKSIQKPYDTEQEPSVEITYLDSENAIEIKEINHKPIYYFYDGLGRWIQSQQLDPATNKLIVQHQIYDELGRVAEKSEPYYVAQTDPAFRIAPDLSKPATEYTYDALGRKLMVIHPDNKTDEFRYEGNKTVYIDAVEDSSWTIKNAFNQKDTLVSFDNGEPLETIFQYNPAGFVEQVTDPRGLLTQYEPNRLGWDVSNLLPDRNMFEYRYDLEGNVTRFEDGIANQEHYWIKTAYDKKNRPIEVGVQNYIYEEWDEHDYSTDYGHQSDYWTYQPPEADLRYKTFQGEYCYHLTYNDDATMIRTFPEEGDVDPKPIGDKSTKLSTSLKAAPEPPEEGTVDWSDWQEIILQYYFDINDIVSFDFRITLYDDNGNSVTEQSLINNVGEGSLTLSLENVNLDLSKISRVDIDLERNDSRTSEFLFVMKSLKLHTVTHHELGNEEYYSKERYIYDSYQNTVSPPSGVNTSNPMGNLVQADYLEGYSQYFYDDRNRVTGEFIDLDGLSSKLIEYSYNSQDQVTEIEYPDGATLIYRYDELGRLKHVDGILNSVTYNASGLPEEVFLKNNTREYRAYTERHWTESFQVKWLDPVAPIGTEPELLLTESYRYTNDGNLHTIQPTLTDDPQIDFEYDDVDRLKKVKYLTVPGENRTYTYDANGNRTSLNFTSYEYPLDSNHLLGYNGNTNRYEYDANGNLVIDYSEGISYVYNWKNELANVDLGTGETVVFAYNHDGKRIRKTTMQDGKPLETLFYIWGHQGRLLAVYDENGQLQWNYIYALGKRIARVNGSGDVQYYHNDYLGNARRITNEDGDVIWQRDYYPFGEERIAEGEGNQLMFTGHERDDETGLDYFQARYYDWETGRFIQVDPKWEKYPSLTPYQYAANNPLIYIDPDGRWIQLAIGGVMGGVSTALTSEKTGWAYAGDIALGTGIGAASALIPGFGLKLVKPSGPLAKVLVSAVSSGSAGGLANLGSQALRNEGINWKSVGTSALISGYLGSYTGLTDVPEIEVVNAFNAGIGMVADYAFHRERQAQGTNDPSGWVPETVVDPETGIIIRQINIENMTNRKLDYNATKHILHKRAHEETQGY